MAHPGQRGTKERRVQLGFLGSQVWMAYLVTPGLPAPEANLGQGDTTAPEETQGFQGKEGLLAYEAPRAFLEEKERKEALCSLQVALKGFKETEGAQEHPAYRDPEVHEDPEAAWETPEHRG